MADIIEYALDRYTDFKKFENLSTEILTLEGFNNLMPIGGVGDEGVDAEIVKYYKDEKQRTVFQYTIQENLTSKISGTISKLAENDVEYEQLIFVTKHQINNISTLKRKARVDHQINIEIYDKKTFIKHLQTENGIFPRYFPDIKSQLNSQLLKSTSLFSSDNSKELLESSLLKCSLLFTFNPEADSTRKDIFDSTILAIIISNKAPISSDETAQKFNDNFGKELVSGELDASISRLKKEKLLKISDRLISPSEFAAEQLEGNLSRVNSASKALVDDISSKAFELSPDKIDAKSESIAATNIQKSLSAYFCLYGLEYTDSAQFVGKKFGFTENQDLIQIARKGLSDKLGELLVYAIGEILKEPTEEQTETLANWARAYIGVQIMGLDPKLKNIQATRLNKKTFVIDTDFLLYSIVTETNLSSLYLRVIKQLVSLGCRIIIPTEVIYEAIKHAEFSVRNYNYFKNSFDKIDSKIIDEKVRNFFVKGYCSAVNEGSIDSSGQGFRTYLSNFYDKDLPYDFIVEVINKTFQDKVEILEISALLSNSIDPHQHEKLTEAILHETNKTFKSTYRSQEENREVAATDAELYLVLSKLNNNVDRNSKEIFNGTHYLITSSTRALRCAKKIGYKHNVISKPNVVINLLERLGSFQSSTTEIVNLFENPYLIEVVNNSWDDIKALIEAGVSLKGKNVVRLKWDLDTEIKSFLANQESTVDENSTQDEKVDEYINFLEKVKEKGYQLVPETEEIVQKFENLKTEISAKTKSEEILKMELDKFGKRRQNYLERVSGIKKRKK